MTTKKNLPRSRSRRLDDVEINEIDNHYGIKYYHRQFAKDKEAMPIKLRKMIGDN